MERCGGSEGQAWRSSLGNRDYSCYFGAMDSWALPLYLYHSLLSKHHMQTAAPDRPSMPSWDHGVMFYQGASKGTKHHCFRAVT